MPENQAESVQEAFFDFLSIIATMTGEDIPTEIEECLGRPLTDTENSFMDGVIHGIASYVQGKLR